MSYPQNDFRDYLEHSAKGQKWKNHKYIEIRNGRYIYPEDVGKTYNYLKNRDGGYKRPESLSDVIDNAQKFSKDARFIRDSIRSRRRFKTKVNAMDRPIVNAKIPGTKSKLGAVLGTLIGKTNGRLASELSTKSSRSAIEKRRKKLKDNEAKRKINARNAEADKNQREVQNVIDRMFKERNSKSIRKSSRR